ncbi:MAG: TadE/TadG family type IV pilus assembly protein [Tepidisphaeraceae bacterium]
MLISQNNRRRRGSAVLEASLVMVPLCYLIFGGIQYGDYFYLKHTLEGAAREGARAAATGTANSDVTNAVASCMDAAGIPSTKYTVLITDTSNANLTISSTTPVAGTAIVVKVQSTWGTIGVNVCPLLWGGIPSSKVIYGSTTMRREG